MNTQTTALSKLTVIAINEENGQIISHHVKAATSYAAFATVAAMDERLTLVTVLPGWLHEGTDIDFPGSTVVEGTTILEQPEVFGPPTIEVTADTIENVLSEYSLRITDTQGKSFATMAAELVDEVNKRAAIAVALEKDSLADMQQALFDNLHAQLVTQGVIEF